ncbi:septum formation initiator family protein [Pelagicoccus sp. SDUM812002]|uniref:FtsB family cell division protein n=1 Tax=Pelagicoccus sp. SDUM812002 TaxID=3041266 RepID=UPI00280E3044|nr:septum formation initiator family protein [Pelagicoccus sp. SDUM812002]MDQ8185513.1 septum formation initiator family protein [Pelagicoccus sp. SDUM812002]
MTARRFTNLFFAVLFIGAGVFAAAFLYRDYQHLDNLRSENTILSKRHAAVVDEATKREAQLDDLQANPEYVESVIRTKLNYAKEGELVFRFER